MDEKKYIEIDLTKLDRSEISYICELITPQIIRQFFKKTDVDADHWRFFIWGVPVLKCRKVRWIKRMARRVLGALGIDVVRLGFSAEEE